MDLNDVVKQCQQDSRDWFGMGDIHGLVHHVLALGGETGEVQNIMKKVDRGSMSFDEALPLLKEEVTDVFIYLCNIVGILNMDLIEEYQEKREFNAKRFS